MKRKDILIFTFTFTSFVSSGVLEFGPCLLHYLEPCTRETIQFYLFTSSRPRDAPIFLDIEDPIVPTYVNLSHTTKMIVHGYAGDLEFNATRSIRNGKIDKPITPMFLFIFNFQHIYHRRTGISLSLIGVT